MPKKSFTNQIFYILEDNQKKRYTTDDAKIEMQVERYMANGH